MMGSRTGTMDTCPISPRAVRAAILSSMDPTPFTSLASRATSLLSTNGSWGEQKAPYIDSGKRDLASVTFTHAVWVSWDTDSIAVW